MDPKFSTSFIPKKPIVTSSESTISVVRETNIFSLVATTLFIVTLLASGGSFAYKKILVNQIESADKQINEARAAFEADKIKDLIDANSRLAATKNLLDNHIVSSKLLALFEVLTVKKARLLQLSYINRNNSQELQLKGETQTYNALADQSNIFGESEFISNPQFSNINPGENGYINFSFTAKVNPKLLSYKRSIESEAAPVSQAQ
jgi:hypothetical protein